MHQMFLTVAHITKQFETECLKICEMLIKYQYLIGHNVVISMLLWTVFLSSHQNFFVKEIIRKQCFI